MQSIKEIENEIVREFDALPDIDAKYAHLFRLGEALPVMDPAFKNDDTLVRGCQSALWFYFSLDKGQCHLQADSDSMMIKGLAALFVRLINGQEPAAVVNISLDFIDRISVSKLASNRNNGLLTMLDHIKNEAKRLSEQHQTAEKGIS